MIGHRPVLTGKHNFESHSPKEIDRGIFFPDAHWNSYEFILFEMCDKQQRFARAEWWVLLWVNKRNFIDCLNLFFARGFNESEDTWYSRAARKLLFSELLEQLDSFFFSEVLDRLENRNALHQSPYRFTEEGEELLAGVGVYHVRNRNAHKPALAEFGTPRNQEQLDSRDRNDPSRALTIYLICWGLFSAVSKPIFAIKY